MGGVMPVPNNTLFKILGQGRPIFLFQELKEPALIPVKYIKPRQNKEEEQQEGPVGLEKAPEIRGFEY
jgi:hypothetical protein